MRQLGFNGEFGNSSGVMLIGMGVGKGSLSMSMTFGGIALLLGSWLGALLSRSTYGGIEATALAVRSRGGSG
jgi:hypothetical protein